MSKQTGQQLGFEALLADAAASNQARAIERKAGHLPAAMTEALPFFRQLLEHHHAAMLAGDVVETARLREKAQNLAIRLNGGAFGYLAVEKPRRHSQA